MIARMPMRRSAAIIRPKEGVRLARQKMRPPASGCVGPFVRAGAQGKLLPLDRARGAKLPTSGAASRDTRRPRCRQLPTGPDL